MKTALMVFLDRKTRSYIRFWNRLAADLAQYDHQLVMLTDNPGPEYAFENYFISYLDKIRPSRRPKGRLWAEDSTRLFRIERHGGRTGDTLDHFGRRLTRFEQYLQRFLRSYSPSLLIVWNSYHTMGAASRAVAERCNIPCVDMERGFFSGTVMLEPLGICGLSQRPSVRSPEADSRYLERFREYYYRNKEEKWTQGRTVSGRDELLSLCGASPVTKVFLFVGSNDHWCGAFDDLHANTAFSRLASSTYDALAKLSTALAKIDTNYHILFKPHPKDHTFDTERATFAGSSNVTICVDLDVFRAIDNADFTVIVNSSILLDVLLKGRRPIVLGNSFFDAFDLPFKLADFADLASIIDDPGDYRPLASTIVSSVNESYLYRLGDDPFIRQGVPELGARIREFTDGPDPPTTATRRRRFYLRMLRHACYSSRVRTPTSPPPSRACLRQSQEIP